MKISIACIQMISTLLLPNLNVLTRGRFGILKNLSICSYDPILEINSSFIFLICYDSYRETQIFYNTLPSFNPGFQIEYFIATSITMSSIY